MLGLKRTSISTLLVLLLLIPASSGAKGNDLRAQRNLFELGIYAGMLFLSDNHELYDYPNIPHRPYKDVSAEIGFRGSYLPLSWIGIELEGGVMPTATTNSESATLYHARGHLLLQYPTMLVPFLVIGSGIFGVSSGTQAAGNDVDYVFHWGGGVKYYAQPWLALRLDARHDVTKAWGPGRVANHFELLGGASVVFGWKDQGPKDRDGDGLPDAQDACPREAANTPDGCPLVADSDGDTVADDRDACPKLAGDPPYGCPPAQDTDGDGVADDKDDCPYQAAKTASGCPPSDSDGDGVSDDKDRCPQLPAPTADGCPGDSDGDGIANDEDTCPDKPETVNGYQDDDGCPDVLPKAAERFSGAVRGIRFPSGSARIKPISYRTLDAAVRVLGAHPSLRLSIRGHTDSTGSRERNMQLSRQRAAAVKLYLVERGIAPERLTIQGVGPDEPIGLNATPSGRAMNRRIEFKIVKR